MELLEREAHLAALGDYAADAASGNGRFVVVTGEAGIGKSALVEAFRETRSDLKWLWGACDGGFTPRPLGPLHEIATEVGGRLRELCVESSDRNDLFAEFAGLLTRPEPGTAVGVVVEDLHWADEASLDWLAYVARRVSRSHSLVIVTYRDDEPGADDLLATVMGRIAAQSSTRRVVLPALTSDAVRRLCTDQDAEEMHLVTGGNPFYVNEILAVGDGVVPPSVADVVRARVLNHTGPAQRMLAGAAVLGRPAPAALLTAVTGVAGAALDECVTSGTLVAQGPLYAFRHELTRRAVELGVPHGQATELHRIALLALDREGGDAAELAHHAQLAGDTDATLHHAARAGREAAGASSHREATSQFRRALACADEATDDVLSDLEERLAESLSTRDLWEEAEAHWERAVSLRRKLGERGPLARCLRRHAVCLWRLCKKDEFARAQAELFDLVRDAEDSTEKGLAFSLVANDPDLAPAERSYLLNECQRIAVALHDDSLLARALLALGLEDSPTGGADFDLLDRALELSLRTGDANVAGSTYVNMFQAAIDQHLYGRYEWLYQAGLDYCLEHEQHTYSVCMRGAGIVVRMRQGALQESLDIGLTTIRETISPVNRMHLCIGLSATAFRLGHPDARRWLEQAWELGLANGETYWTMQVATSAAQGAWLTGDDSLVDDRVLEQYRLGLVDDPWVHGELAAWLVRLGRVTDVPPRPGPYGAEVIGDHLDAARQWRELGCPFEEAVALTWAGDSDSLQRAFELFTGIGSKPAAAIVRTRLRSDGHAVPRGPRAATKAHPDGLTSREAEVLALLGVGLTNAEIASRLFVSPRTIDHHVSAVLAKLGVSSRNDAVARAGALAK